MKKKTEYKDLTVIDRVLAIPMESRFVEFKRLGSRKEVVGEAMKSIVAMANTDGGILIIGVNDPLDTKFKGYDRIFGIEENTPLFDELGRILKKIYPPIMGIWPPDIIEVPSHKKRVAILNIPKVSDGLRSYEGHVYMRGEQGNHRLSPQEIIHFSYVKGFERADRELVPVDFGLLDTEYYRQWKNKRQLSDREISTVLEKTGLARKNKKGKLLPTRAAVLLFTEYPNDLLDSKCTVRVFQYEGKLESIKETVNLLGIPKNLHGPIVKLITEAQNYVLEVLQSGLKVSSGFVNKYKIPERAVKEGITNAVIHRDYHTKKDIEIRIFEDRIEIESPGLLPFNITPSNIGIVRAHEYRNDLLVKHLREFPEPPNLDQNEGVRAMRQVMKTASMYPPIFITYPHKQDSVMLVLLNEQVSTEWDKISAYLLDHKYISNKEARSILGTDNPIKVSKLFHKWVRQGLLTKIVPRTGAKRNVTYRLPTNDEKSLFTNSKGK